MSSIRDSASYFGENNKYKALILDLNKDYFFFINRKCTTKQFSLDEILAFLSK